MIQFSLSWLHAQLEPSGKAPANLLEWYLDLDANQSERLAPYLTEPPGKVTKAYILRADPKDPDLAAMKVIDVHAGNQGDFPFNQASGPRSPAIGPVVKRTKSKVKIAPTDVIATSTLKHFKAVAEAGDAWSPFFAEAHDILTRPKLAWNGEIISDPHPNAYQTAVQVIDETETVFVSIEDSKERRPGQVPEYAIYLQGILAETKYATNTAPALPETRCALTGITGICYANGLAGARVNLSNVDRPGAFPGVTTDNAGKRFAISRQACDLLYIFRFHLLPKLLAEVGGSRALVLPTFLSSRKAFQKKIANYIKKLNSTEIEGAEAGLTRMYLEEETAVAGLHFVWATFGQKMEDVTFQINDVLPSRVLKLQNAWDAYQLQESPFTPRQLVDRFQDIAWMNAAYYLYRRPGGKAAKAANSHKLRDFVQHLIPHIYRGRKFENTDRLISEAIDVARYSLRDMRASSGKVKTPFFGLLKEGDNPKRKTSTLASTIKAQHQFLRFLISINLLEMEYNMQNVEFEPLHPFLGENSGINTPGRRASFILGLLFGHLVNLQERRKVSVGANAVPIIKNYDLSPRDFSGVLKKIREKLVQYESDPNSQRKDAESARKKFYISPRARMDKDALIKELGRLASFEVEPDIPKEHLNYYLILGQAFSGDIFYRKSNESKETIQKGDTA